MSPRTLIVGVLAAVCGVSATAGVLMWNRPPAGDKQSIVTAKLGIELGTKIEPHMLSLEDWYSAQLPPGAATTVDEVVGKYCTSPIYKGQPVQLGLLDDAPTTLQPEPGYFAMAIETETESSNLGKNLVAGNRVDVIWTMTQKHEDLGGPFSKRLLENVRVLAVGQNSTASVGVDSRRDLKSVTLEVKARMDENLFLAQELGTLSLSMRNPNDQEGIEPVQITNISDLIDDVRSEKQKAAVDPVKGMIDGVLGQINELSKKVESLSQKPVTTVALNDESRRRIPGDMRAITIQTPSESTGVAGLLLPGHRVDVVVTWDNDVFDCFNLRAKERESRSLVLLENVEVLAVDTQVIVRDDNQEKEMSRSVTLIGTLEMTRQITQAELLGTITLVLRGLEDSQSSEPRLVCNLDEYLGSCMAQSPVPTMSADGKKVEQLVVPVKLNRGGANQDQMFLVRQPAADRLPDDQ
jgi:pilus assembly protein CpaB